MKTIAGCLIAPIALAAMPAFAACEMPSLVTAIPDGSTATEQELVAVQTEIRAYITAMDDYIACENEAMDAVGDDGSATYSHFLFLMTSRIEAARQEVDRVATEFNEQVEVFRARPPSVATGALPPLDAQSTPEARSIR